MTARSVSVFLAIFLCAAGLRGVPQSDSLIPARPDAMADSRSTPGLDIRVNVNSVMLNTSVRDRTSNRSISGLETEDFRVYEDGVLQHLQEAKITDAPLNLLLLMDVSGSTYSFMKLMKKAASEFLYEMDQNDMIAIASFNSKPHLLQDFTSNFDGVAKAISHLHSGGGTAFYDALMKCVDQYMRNVEGRKAIVVFTDGVDNLLQGNHREGSHISFEKLYSRLEETDALVYTIFLNSRGKEIMPASESSGKSRGSRSPEIGRVPLPVPAAEPGAKPRTQPQENNRDAYATAYEQLEAIAQLTGGRTYSPRLIEELSGVYAEVADDLRIQYLLSYASSNTDQKDGWRAVRVVVKDHPEAAVRTRSGYTVSHR